MKKRFSIGIITFLLALSSVGGVQAFATAPIINDAPASEQSYEISNRAEEVEWVFRIHNGVKQYRIWSYTEGEWLNDWTDC